MEHAATWGESQRDARDDELARAGKSTADLEFVRFFFRRLCKITFFILIFLRVLQERRAK